MNRHTQSKTGFTLIEVVLVLAIGGSLFLLAFLAFRQVSANRRDSERRTMVRRILADAITFTGDANGKFPCSESGATWGCGSSPSWDNFRSSNLEGKYKNPSGPDYLFDHTNGNRAEENISQLYIGDDRKMERIALSLKGTCENGDLVIRSTNPEGSYGVWIGLEGSRGACVDNT